MEYIRFRGYLCDYEEFEPSSREMRPETKSGLRRLWSGARVGRKMLEQVLPTLFSALLDQPLDFL